MPITPTNIKLICSDIDGTLLQYGKKTLEAEILSQIKALSARGILFCPASGRQYTSLRKLFEPVADCCVFLCENGGVLYKNEQCIGKTPMPRALAEEIAWDMWNRCDGQGEVMLSGQCCGYLMSRGLGMADRVKFIGNKYKFIHDPAEIPEDIVKVSVYLHEGVEKYVDRFVPRWGDGVKGKFGRRRAGPLPRYPRVHRPPRDPANADWLRPDPGGAVRHAPPETAYRRGIVPDRPPCGCAGRHR